MSQMKSACYDLRNEWSQHDMTYASLTVLIAIWNSLSDYVVSSNTVSIFKHRLDNYCLDQDVKYNYKADLHGIGNRSIVS